VKAFLLPGQILTTKRWQRHTQKVITNEERRSQEHWKNNHFTMDNNVNKIKLLKFVIIKTIV